MKMYKGIVFDTTIFMNSQERTKANEIVYTLMMLNVLQINIYTGKDII